MNAPEKTNKIKWDLLLREPIWNSTAREIPQIWLICMICTELYKIAVLVYSLDDLGTEC